MCSSCRERWTAVSHGDVGVFTYYQVVEQADVEELASGQRLGDEVQVVACGNTRIDEAQAQRIVGP
jgi:hypothetical protein